MIGLPKISKWVIACVLVGIAVGGGVTYAATQYIWKGSGSVTVVSPGAINDAQFSIYWDEACTNPVTTFDFGQVTISASYTTKDISPIYIKNEGDGNVEIDGANPDTSMWAWKKDATTCIIVCTILNGEGTVLVPGEVRQGKFHVQIKDTTPPGTYNFELPLLGIGR